MTSARGRVQSPEELTPAQLDHLRKQLESRSRRNGSCVEWLGALDNGYGVTTVSSRLVRTHRAAYFVYHGVPPEGHIVCHTCDNRLCIRSDHIYAGTHSDNMRDMIERGQHNPSRGERSGQCKLTDKQVAEIRRRYRPPVKRGAGNKGYATALAEEFGVTPAYILDLVRGKWRATP